MSEEKSAVTPNVTVTDKKKLSFPTKFSVKKGTLMKIGVAIVIALVLVPVLDWVVQTSITSQYVAFYKNADVSRAAYIKEMERQYGDQVVNSMLAKSAIAQAADERGIKVTDAEVNTAIDADKQKAGITTDADFNAALEQNGITLTDYKAYVKVTVTLDKLIEGTVSAPTDAEISTYYTQNKTQLYAGKKLEEVKTQIVSDLTQTAISTKREEWISKALTGYNASNTLVSASSRSYKFLKSIDLVKRLFSNDPTK